MEFLNKPQREALMKKSLEKIRFGDSISQYQPQEPYIADENNHFTLKSLEELNNNLESRCYEMSRPLTPFT